MTVPFEPPGPAPQPPVPIEEIEWSEAYDPALQEPAEEPEQPES